MISLLKFKKKPAISSTLKQHRQKELPTGWPCWTKRLFPEIICANEADYQTGAAPYYTNSTQLPVNYTDDVFETLQLQDKLQTKYTGGTVLHIYLGEQVDDPAVTKHLIRKIANRFHLPYFTLSPTFSICPSHGYLKGEKPMCDCCNQETEIYSRVVGYLRPIKQWNPGKQAEFNLRKTYKVLDQVNLPDTETKQHLRMNPPTPPRLWMAV